MMKFIRPASPDFIRNNWEEWGTEWKSKLNQNPSITFNWKSHQGKRVNISLIQYLRDATNQHFCYCDSYPVQQMSRETIDHFKPKRQIPELAYQWENLFYSCDKCQSSKLEKYDDLLLKPDADNYSFETCFIYNSLTGELELNPLLEEMDKNRVKFTITIFGLNNKGRCITRKQEIRNYQNEKEKKSLGDFSYRFLLTDL